MEASGKAEVKIGPDGLLYDIDGEERYVDGVRSVILKRIHAPDKCAAEYCVIHNPSDHSMREFPTLWRWDRRLMERICPHGVGHPDPDHIAATRKLSGDDAAKVEAVHGCDGCCKGAYDGGP